LQRCVAVVVEVAIVVLAVVLVKVALMGAQCPLDVRTLTGSKVSPNDETTSTTTACSHTSHMPPLQSARIAPIRKRL
jgi:hypothetical protein